MMDIEYMSLKELFELQRKLGKEIEKRVNQPYLKPLEKKTLIPNSTYGKTGNTSRG